MRKRTLNGLKQLAPVLPASIKRSQAATPILPITCFYPRQWVTEPIKNGICFLAHCQINYSTDSSKRFSEKSVITPEWSGDLADSEVVSERQRLSALCWLTRAPLSAKQTQRRWWFMWSESLFWFTPNSPERQNVLISSQPLKTSCFLWCFHICCSPALGKVYIHWRTKLKNYGWDHNTVLFLTI